MAEFFSEPWVASVAQKIKQTSKATDRTKNKQVNKKPRPRNKTPPVQIWVGGSEQEQALQQFLDTAEEALLHGPPHGRNSMLLEVFVIDVHATRVSRKLQ